MKTLVGRIAKEDVETGCATGSLDAKIQDKLSAVYLSLAMWRELQITVKTLMGEAATENGETNYAIDTVEAKT